MSAKKGLTRREDLVEQEQETGKSQCRSHDEGSCCASERQIRQYAHNHKGDKRDHQQKQRRIHRKISAFQGANLLLYKVSPALRQSGRITRLGVGGADALGDIDVPQTHQRDQRRNPQNQRRDDSLKVCRGHRVHF